LALKMLVTKNYLLEFAFYIVDIKNNLLYLYLFSYIIG
jgi:hypothetical protein